MNSTWNMNLDSIDFISFFDTPQINKNLFIVSNFSINFDFRNLLNKFAWKLCVVCNQNRSMDGICRLTLKYTFCIKSYWRATYEQRKKRKRLLSYDFVSRNMNFVTLCADNGTNVRANTNKHHNSIASINCCVFNVQCSLHNTNKHQTEASLHPYDVPNIVLFKYHPTCRASMHPLCGW